MELKIIFDPETEGEPAFYTEFEDTKKQHALAKKLFDSVVVAWKNGDKLVMLDDSVSITVLRTEFIKKVELIGTDVEPEEDEDEDDEDDSDEDDEDEDEDEEEEKCKECGDSTADLNEDGFCEACAIEKKLKDKKKKSYSIFG